MTEVITQQIADRVNAHWGKTCNDCVKLVSDTRMTPDGQVTRTYCRLTGVRVTPATYACPLYGRFILNK